MAEKVGIVDLFAGIGGVSLGFEEEGSFETIAMIDINKNAYETYLENYPDAPYFNESIEKFSGSRIKKLNHHSKFGIVGCPPCQGFSAAGKRNPNDPRNLLADDFFRIVYESDPDFVVLENVPEIFNSKSFMEHLFFLQTHKRYRIWHGILNSALYGVPQTRQRAIVIAYHSRLGILPSFPKPTHCGSKEIFDYSKQKLVKVNSSEGLGALGVYPQTMNFERNKKAKVDWIKSDLEQYSNLTGINTISEALDDLPKAEIEGKETFNGHVSRIHDTAMISKMHSIKEGGRYEHPEKKYYSQAYGRLHGQGLARTITRYFSNPGSGRYIHHRENRSITPREAARLQGIDDDFNFVHGSTINSELIGNAFPRPMANAIAKEVASLIK